MSNKKKLLIYAHYYIPDTASTGQILRELAEGMLDKFDITVICVVPSYLGTIEEKYKTDIARVHNDKLAIQTVFFLEDKNLFIILIQRIDFVFINPIVDHNGFRDFFTLETLLYRLHQITTNSDYKVTAVNRVSMTRLRKTSAGSLRMPEIAS